MILRFNGSHGGSHVPSRVRSHTVSATGSIWIIDAGGCDPSALRSLPQLEALFERIIADLGLHPMQAPVWQRFPDPGGVTGFVVLAESHLSIHTFPELGYAAIDLYCCKARPEWDWRAALAQHLGAREVELRCLARGLPSEVLR